MYNDVYEFLLRETVLGKAAKWAYACWTLFITKTISFSSSLCLNHHLTLQNPLASDSPPSAKPSILSEFSVYLFGFSTIRLVFPTPNCRIGKIECLLYFFHFL